MAGLNLISTYSSDSEENEDESTELSKTSNRLPLPESIATWKGVKHHEEVVDDPSLHEGRVRSFKHERGNWATLVYLNYTPSQTLMDWMLDVSKELPVRCNTFSNEFHISVTRTLILKFHWIESFIEDLKKLCSRTDRFTLELLNLRVYCNDEKTRTFVGIECMESSGTLDRLIKDLNDLLAEYGLPSFYQERSYHISFLWCLGDETKSFNGVTTMLNSKFNEFLAENVEDREIHVNEVHFRTGNQLYAFKLR